MVSLSCKRLYVTEVCQARSELLLLVGDDQLLWLFPFKGGSPVSSCCPGISLNEAPHAGELGCRSRRILGPIIICQHPDVASLQCPEFKRHGYVWAIFLQDVKQRAEVDHALPQRTADKTISLLAQLDPVILEMHIFDIGSNPPGKVQGFLRRRQWIACV